MPNRRLSLRALAAVAAATSCLAGCALLARPAATPVAPGSPLAPGGVPSLAADALPGEWESLGVVPMTDDPDAVACLGDERAVLPDAVIVGGVISGYRDVDLRFYVRQTVYPSADPAAELELLERGMTECFGEIASRDTVLADGTVVEERAGLTATALDLPRPDFAYEGGRTVADTVTLFVTAWYAAEGAIVEVEIDYLAGAEVTNDEVTAILAPFEAQLP